MSLTELFCEVDDFCQRFEPQWQAYRLDEGQRQRQRRGHLTLSETMTLLIHFHQSAYRNFKHYYTDYVAVHLRAAFPTLISYSRFVGRLGEALGPLCAYLSTRKAPPTGLAFVDATALAVCDNRRIRSHRVFEGLAARGKTSMGWFYGFKLHLIINDQGGLLAYQLTAGNTDDRTPLLALCRGLYGKLFGDKGYISQAKTEALAEQGVELITRRRRTMKPKPLSDFDRSMLKHRSIIETIFDQLKNISHIEHSRHRSPLHFLINVIAGLIAYTWQAKKPALKIHSTYPALA